MLKRKIEQELLAWKNMPNHKPLILKGCRQCGKTFSALHFARKHYEHVVYLNFFENPDYASVFAGSLKTDHIVRRCLKREKPCLCWTRYRTAPRPGPH